MKKYKYLNDIGIKNENIPKNWKSKFLRRCRLKKQRRIYGFDEREIWNFDYTFYLFIYERLCMFRDKSIKYINLSFHKIIFKDNELTLGECINKMVDGFALAIKSDSDELTDNEKEKYNDAFDLLKITLPYLWY